MRPDATIGTAAAAGTGSAAGRGAGAGVVPLAPPPVVIGGGLAGLATALAIAPRPVVLLVAAPLGTGAATGWAQGGIAAVTGADDDASFHLADTLAAGDGLSDPAASASILADAPAAIARLASFGVAFDRDEAGALRLGLEAAHGRRRIVHADGDGTGRAVLAALAARVASTPAITVVHGTARRLLRDGNGRIAGVSVLPPHGAPFAIGARDVVIATGGLGALWSHTTNPERAVGHGVALAAAAGATLADLEFVQFHPTAIDCGRDPMPLASEALRGEGAVLIDETGTRFMLGCDDARGAAELAPRDVVARAVTRRLADGHQVFLDARDALGARFAARFPSVDALCRACGIDPARAPIPVRPAAHYAMGGIRTDGNGRTDVPGLWAAGEAAATGLHGANRLASNSLAEAAVMGERIGRALNAADGARPAPSRTLALVAADGARDAGHAPIRPLMTRGFGVLRDGIGMRDAARDLLALRHRPGIDQAALVAAELVAASALLRIESRGAHARTDATARDAIARRQPITLGQARATLDAVSLGKPTTTVAVPERVRA